MVGVMALVCGLSEINVEAILHIVCKVSSVREAMVIPRGEVKVWHEACKITRFWRQVVDITSGTSHMGGREGRGHNEPCGLAQRKRRWGP